MPNQEAEVKEMQSKYEDPQSENGFDSAAPEAETVPVGAASKSDSNSGSGEAAEETVSRTEYEQLKGERDQLVDRLARLQAEFENARKRSERERVEFRDYAAANVVEQFLPVLDNFELALKATGTTEQLRAGVELIVKQMEEILRQLNVSSIPAVGEQFNPHHHEAIGSIERDDLPDHSVAEEIRRGYKIREKLLRPAMVRVVSNPKQTVV